MKDLSVPSSNAQHGSECTSQPYATIIACKAGRPSYEFFRLSVDEAHEPGCPRSITRSEIVLKPMSCLLGEIRARLTRTTRS